MTDTVTTGTLVTIAPEWRNAGEGEEVFVVVEGPQDGRVTISPTFGKWAIVPREVVPVASVLPVAGAQ